MTVEYFLGDHLGSTSITTDNTGAKVSEMRYKPWGEVRSWWTAGLATTPDYKLPDYTFTGQFSDSYINLLWYGSQHYDPYGETRLTATMLTDKLFTGQREMGRPATSRSVPGVIFS